MYIKCVCGRVCHLAVISRCCRCGGGHEGGEEPGEERRRQKRGGFFHKSAEVASIARIPASDIILGKSANDVCCTMCSYMYMYTYTHMHLFYTHTCT